MIPLSSDEKAFVIERGERVVLVRLHACRHCGLFTTSAIALQTACDVGEIDRNDAGNWIVHQVDDAGLEEGYKRLERWRKVTTKSVANS